MRALIWRFADDVAGVPQDDGTVLTSTSEPAPGSVHVHVDGSQTVDAFVPLLSRILGKAFLLANDQIRGG